MKKSALHEIQGVLVTAGRTDLAEELVVGTTWKRRNAVGPGWEYREGDKMPPKSKYSEERWQRVKKKNKS